MICNAAILKQARSAGALEMMAMVGYFFDRRTNSSGVNRRENDAGDSCCNRAAIHRRAAEHPRAFGTMLDLAIPDERDYETIRRKRI